MAPEASGERPGAPATGWALAAAIGVAVYVVVDVVLQLLPPHYSPVSDAESDLGVGPFGWLMDINFLIRAAMTLCLLVAITRAGPATSSRRVGCVLLAVGAACSGLLAFFPTDVAPADGREASVTTVHGSIHLAIAGIGFLAALAGIIVLTGWYRQRAGANGATSAPVVLAVVAVAAMLATVITLRVRPAVFGLSERVFVGAILAWALVVALRLRRSAG